MRDHHAGFAAKFAVLVTTCTAWASTSSLATAATDPPVAAPFTRAAFVALPVIRDVAVSPGGKMLAWLDATHGEQHILLYDIAAKKVLRVLAIDANMTYRSLVWSDDSTLLYTVSITEGFRSHGGGDSSAEIKREFYRMFSTGITDTAQHMMLGSDGYFNDVTGMHLLKLHVSKPNTIIVSTYNWTQGEKRLQTGTLIPGGEAANGWVWTVYEIDTHTGKGTRVEVGDLNTDHWIIDHDGKIVARTEWYPELQTFSVLVKRPVGWSRLYETKRTSPLDAVELDSSETALLTIEPDTDGRKKLWSVPLDGSPRKVSVEDPTGEVTGVFNDSVSGVPEGAHILSGTHKSTLWFDKAEQERHEMLSRSFPKRHCAVVSESADKQLAVIRLDGPSDPPSFYLVNLGTHQANPVGDEYPDLADRKLGEFSSFHYKAHDGTEIPAYLTLPPGASNTPLPLVVLPHGGPNSRDSGSDFEWLRQHLAIRGYAVFQPQFRGSSGHGADFERAGDRQWGLLMQDDLTDGVRALIAQGRVDPHRICLLGYSYGSGYAGYAALAGVAFTPDLYRCAISVNGIFDLPRYLGYSIEQSNYTTYWRKSIGEQSDPSLVDRSPIHAVERITAPILLLYSANDWVVPTNQSQSMAATLQKAGRNVRLIEIRDADHELSRLPARVQSVEEIDRFLQDHL